jgi:hypothetical protein
MGQVVAATDLMTDRQVALKLLTSERTGDPTAAARMMREAMVATKLGGRHTGRIFDAGLHDNGQPILVLELLDGEDLAQRLARVGPLPEPEAIAMTLDACEGLAEAHAIRLIHRDIKPSNLFVAIDVGGESVVKVIDFGAAKLDPSRGDTLTMTTTVIGSVAYMAPEQLRKLEVDERTDLWALGVVLFELVSNRRPFPAETITDASIRIAVEPPEPLPSTVSAPLAEVISRCLEKQPERRFQTVAELAAALAELLPDRRAQALRIERTLGNPTRALRNNAAAPIAPTARVEQRRSRARSIRDWIATHWLVASLVVFVWSMSMLLGSFAVTDELNEFVVDGKPIGYMSSFNWTVVHSCFTPMLVALVGILLRAIGSTMTALGPSAVAGWDARARRVMVTWLVLAGVLAVGYSVVEWSFVTTGRCDGGTYLGWPNQLCRVSDGEAGVLLFMGFAAGLQATILVAAWLLLSIVIWLADVCFGAKRAELGASSVPAIARLFRIATAGWALILVALLLARLWSVHLRTEKTNGIVSTMLLGLPGSLFDIEAHTQTDYGSIVAALIIVVAAGVPVILLRTQFPAARNDRDVGRLWRAVIALAAIGVPSMTFPRLGFFLIPGSVFVALIARARRSSR